MTRRTLAVVAAGVSAAAAATLVAPSASAAPPSIPSVTTAKAQLAGLTVAPAGGMSGYSRAKFPHWSVVSGYCDTRETVLKRDGTSVSAGADCYPTSGSWRSPYDGITLTTASSVDIDHVIPLAEGWRSGAATWTTAKRERFANDLSSPQLIAVSATSNRSKGDQDPAQWLPPSTGFRCTYVRMWIGAKHAWSLTVDAAEKTALTTELGRC